MKATINGTIVEGTPKEVWELIQQADAQGTNLKPVSPMPRTIDCDWVRGLPQVTSGGTKQLAGCCNVHEKIADAKL